MPDAGEIADHSDRPPGSLKSRQPDGFHVDLAAQGVEIDPNTVWSNNPDDMSILTFFNDKINPPSLATTYNIPGLMPVIVRPGIPGGGDDYILTDAESNFYTWNTYTQSLMFIIGQKDLQTVVDMAIDEAISGKQLEPQYIVKST